MSNYTDTPTDADDVDIIEPDDTYFDDQRDLEDALEYERLRWEEYASSALGAGWGGVPYAEEYEPGWDGWQSE